MANYFADTLKVKSVYVLDDSGAYGVGIADAFQEQAEKRGIKVLGRDQLNPKEADYTTILTKIKSLNPDALYYGGVAQAGVKVVKQSYDILPKMIKGGGDGMLRRRDPQGRRLPGGRGLVCDDRRAERAGKPGRQAVGRDASPRNTDSSRRTTRSPPMMPRWSSSTRSSGSPPRARRSIAPMCATRSRPRTSRRLQGEVSFDENGDITNRIISVFQIVKDPKYPLDDVLHQYKYMGVAPQSS